MKRVVVSSVAAVALLGSGLAVAGAVPAAGSPDPVKGVSSAGSAAATSLLAGPSRLLQGQALHRDPTTLTRSEAAAMEARQQRILDGTSLKISARPNGSVMVPIEFHNVGNRHGDGFVSKKQIRAQVRVLNRAYAGRTSPRAANTPFRFRINSIDRTKNSDWYNADFFTKDGRIELREMRRELHVGNARHLNMYSVGLKVKLLGFANYPTGKHPRLDGVVLLNESLPGGAADFGTGSVYNRGDTGTHEVGHWLNLPHTFQGSCGRLNDYVTDTPRQRAGDNIFEEDPTLDTCKPHGPNSKDPVRNFMNYTDDPFMDNFTRGQRDRMNTSWYIRLALAQSD